MAAPVLADYTYQYSDTGILLNGSVTLPFWDVQKVTGLDMATYDAKIDDYDGQHGGPVYARWAKPRTIIIEGTLYASPALVEVAIDAAITNFIPDVVNPFYYKHPGVAQRYVSCLPISFASDTETMRRIGAGAFQIQLVGNDPRKYINNANQIMAAATNYTPSNPGNVATYPIFTIVGAFTAISLTNNTTTEVVTLTTTRIAGDVTIVDFNTRSVTINGIQSSSVVSAGAWWQIPAGGAQTVKYTVTGGPPTSVTMATKQAWL